MASVQETHINRLEMHTYINLNRLSISSKLMWYKTQSMFMYLLDNIKNNEESLTCFVFRPKRRNKTRGRKYKYPRIQVFFSQMKTSIKLDVRVSSQSWVWRGCYCCMLGIPTRAYRSKPKTANPIEYCHSEFGIS